MSLKPMADLLADAESGGYAVGAFNVSDLNQAHAVMEAARSKRSPVIVQTVPESSPYSSEEWWWKRLREVVGSYPDVSVALHLDHGRTLEECLEAVACGFTSVMIDASRDNKTGEPTTLEENIERTRAVVQSLQGSGVSVEGELGTIGGKEGETEDFEDIVLADPDVAERFVDATGIDALAVAVGTSHGAVKFVEQQGKDQLRIDLVEAVKAKVPGCYLVLHGASSIPLEAIELINANGGDIPVSYGIDPEQKARAISAGIRKINQGTDSHLSWTAQERRSRALNPEVADPSSVIKAAMAGMRDNIALRMDQFGSAGKD